MGGRRTRPGVFQNGRFYAVKTDKKPFGAVSGIIARENGDLWLKEAHGIVNITASEIDKLREDPEYMVKYRLLISWTTCPAGRR